MPTQFTQGHALLVGVGADLPNTVDDAKGIADLLLDSGRCAYPPDQVTVLVGENATRGHILTALVRLVQTSGPDDTVIVYFSGHGYRVKTPFGAHYYLMPFGYDVNSLPDTAISGAEFVERLRALQARKLLLLLDCCHAGGLDDTKVAGVQLSKEPLPPEAQSLFAAGTGRIAIASSTADELSYAGKPYSAFTLALAEALCGDGVSEKDGYVRAADLALHARQMVSRRTHDRQHPILNFDGADNFIVAYYAGGNMKPKGLPFDPDQIEIECEPGSFRTQINQQGQTLHGPQTNIGGNVQGDVYSGDIGQLGNRTVNTGGGTYVERNVHTGGDFVGRDKIDNRGGFHQPGWQVGPVNQGSGDIHNTDLAGDQFNTGTISGTGVAQGRSSQTHIIQGTSRADLASLFAQIYTQIESRPETPDVDKHEIVDTVNKIETEVGKGEDANLNKIERWLRTLKEIAPDVLDVTAQVLVNPVGGVAEGIRKVVVRLRRSATSP